MRRRCLAFGALTAAACLGSPLRAAGSSADQGRIVQLPPFVVKDTRLLPPPESWRYARAPGFEILSSASDGTTEDMVHDFLLFHRAFEAVWPTVRMNAAVSASIILCRSAGRFAEFIPANLAGDAGRTLSLTLQDRENAAIVVNLENRDAGGSGEGADADSGSRSLLHAEYVQFVVNRIGPRTPPWIRAALDELCGAMLYRKAVVVIPKISDPDLGARRAFAAAKGGLGSDKAFENAVRAGAFMALDKLFEADPAGADESGGADDPWTRESYEFLHLCLFGAGQAYRVPFLKFAYLSAREPATEELFRSCFGMGTRDMLAILWAYTGFAAESGFELEGGDRRPLGDVPPLALRKATDAESARIKGEAQRMAGRIEDARYSLIAPYYRGSRDPQLLAALGLAEEAAGRDERARTFLEAACALGTDRARAWVELARLRLKDELAHPAGGGGRLDEAQLVGVLKPLFSARKLPPPLPGLYEEIAEAWSRAAIRPGPAHVAAVDEGVRLFPYDLDLVYADAKLHEQIGRGSEAAALCDLGAALAADPAARERFAALKASLGMGARASRP